MTEQKLLKLKATLFDRMIDEKCEWEGPRGVIMYLIENGCTREEILALNFDEAHVDDLLEEYQKEE